MVNANIHKTILIIILKEIYSDPLLRNILGFKGGTAAMLFYRLPRLSVDLDFDLLDTEKKLKIIIKLKKILPQFGTVKEAIEKRDTIFFLLNYTKGERNLKIEISKRPSQAKYIQKNFLGISMLIMKKEDMLANKLSAVLTRKKFASRDLFDLWYFLKNNWQITENIIKKNCHLSLSDALKKTRIQIKTIKNTHLLSGLGDLLNNKQKTWVKEKLVNDLLFQLELYEKTH